MSGRSDDIWQTPSSDTSSFSVIEANSVTFYLLPSWKLCHQKAVKLRKSSMNRFQSVTITINVMCIGMTIIIIIAIGDRSSKGHFQSGKLLQETFSFLSINLDTGQQWCWYQVKIMTRLPARYFQTFLFPRIFVKEQQAAEQKNERPLPSWLRYRPTCHKPPPGPPPPPPFPHVFFQLWSPPAHIANLCNFVFFCCC